MSKTDFNDFEYAVGDWESHEDWQFADRAAERKFFFKMGMITAANIARKEPVIVFLGGAELKIRRDVAEEIRAKVDEI